MALNRLSSSSSDDFGEVDACLNLANRLIRLCSLPYQQITSLEDMRSHFFIKLFEQICDASVPDIMKSPKTDEEEAHNVQAVIDTLSMDVLNVNLSHIAGEDVIAGNTRAIQNLLEVFEGYLVYLSDDVKHLKESIQGNSANETHEEALKLEKSRCCDLCGYDPKIDGKDVSPEAEATPTSNWVCPICSYENVPSICEDSKKSSDLENSRSPQPSDLASPKPEFEAKKTKSGNIDTCDRIAVEKIDDVSRKSSGLFSTSFEADDILMPPFPLKDDEKHRFESSKSGMFTSSKSKEEPCSTSKSPEEQNDRMSRWKSRSVDDIRAAGLFKVDEFSQTSDSLMKEQDEEIHGDITRKTIRLKRKPSDQHLPYANEEDILELYEQNMVKRIAAFLDKTHYRQNASQIRRNYLQSVRPYKRRQVSPYRSKSNSVSHSTRRGPVYTTPKRIYSRKVYSSPRKTVQKAKPEEKTLIKEIMEEFPGIQLSPSTVRQITDKYWRHLMTMHKKVKDSLSKKSQTQVQKEEAFKRQKILSDLFKKDVKLSKRMNELDEMKTLERRIKANARDAKIESVRVKHYYDEFYEDMKRRLQKKNYGEELLLKSLFDEALTMQKDQVNALRKQMKEREEKDAKSHQIYLESLENFYQNQFSMIAKSLAVEKHDMEMRTKAQQRVMDAMKREHRSHLENEVRRMQENILRSNEDIHFREMDAERFRETLRDRFRSNF